ncbi:MAG: helix-turn-helix transcriptional regulator [Paramuribaculum sp.]|nr:helix-turn-helix transcriptional regulator [Paramuribaculum sp.]
MSTIRELEDIMSAQSQQAGELNIDTDIIAYAQTMADIENAIVVISDMAQKRSRIFLGTFARELGINDYDSENSIWEKVILSYLSEAELETKMISELRFYHFIKNKPKSRRNYYLLTKLRFQTHAGRMADVAHKLYYIYDDRGDAVKYAVCRYAPLTFDFRGKSVIVNSIDGSMEELTTSDGKGILSRRERQVMSLIAEGKKSAEIAELLSVSIHTVSRHRQEILAKLQVKNSIDACRLARSMELI